MMKAFYSRKEGSIAILGAFAMTAVLLLCAFAIEASRLYVDKLQAQRAADMANLAAANTSEPIANGLPSAQALATVRQMMEINGFGSADATTTTRTNADGTVELTTLVESRSVVGFSDLMSTAKTAPVSARSSALVGEGSGECVRSLQGPVNIYNNSVFDGPNCLIAAATYLYVCHAAAVTATAVEVKYKQGPEKAYICNKTPMKPVLERFIFGKESQDPLGSDPRIKAIEQRLRSMTAWPYTKTIPKTPLKPATSGGRGVTSFTETKGDLPAGGSYGGLSLRNATVTFSGGGTPDPTCSHPTTISGSLLLSGTNRLIFDSGCYAIGGPTVSNDGKTSFESVKDADVTLVFGQYIDNIAGTLVFGDMTFSFAGDVRNRGNGTVTFGVLDEPPPLDPKKVRSFSFGAGIINGSGTLRFGNGPHYLDGGSISNGTGTLTFGHGAFYLWGGSMSNASTGRIEFGDGPFYFHGGTVTNVAGTMIFGDGGFAFYGGTLALDADSITRFGRGNVDFYGGSASFLGKSTIFGGSGNAEKGASSFFFYGGSFSMKTESLTAIGTTFAFWGGSVSLYGIGSMTITAPTGRAPDFGYSNILFYVHGGAFSLYQGAVTDTMSGIIYVPDTNVSIYGSQTVRIPEHGCFQVIAGIFDFYQKASSQFKPCLTSESGGGKVRITR